ncbi:FAD-dependent thymidylate synthase [Sphingopyxis flava]|uniref:Thymidylate synthase complementing protein n=1 Tax=Sphingopyxis flava TaxID=1507287 RepID=A0A1T5CVQ8_9SPHN|nr:FAD-dependent thymidylate synthase [Sphingopyxis flava]SKB63421.1 Thymidylate synthase complementing protein [Sphingopyxis flava]
MTTISSTTILRSRNAAAPDKVLSTLLLRYPRCIHAEFMTHRVFSRNAASSRAIPVEKLIKDVEENPFIPVYWGANQRGMQAGDEIDAPLYLQGASHFDMIDRCYDPISKEAGWLHARDQAISAARAFAKAGYHKQIVNRLLEPFAHITVLVSGTEWDNFLELRDHEAAEPHIQILAREVRKCLEREDDIQDLEPGEWHLPFVDEKVMEVRPRARGGIHTSDAIKLSVARCASTSYKTVDGFDMTLDKAVELHDRLVGSTPIHASPAEHVAQADGVSRWETYDGEGSDTPIWENKREHGNFIGFRQYRHML